MFKQYKFKPQEELNVDNFKENLGFFASYLQNNKITKLYNSF